jgi:hypothetical protein
MFHAFDQHHQEGEAGEQPGIGAAADDGEIQRDAAADQKTETQQQWLAQQQQRRGKREPLRRASVPTITQHAAGETFGDMRAHHHVAGECGPADILRADRVRQDDRQQHRTDAFGLVDHARPREPASERISVPERARDPRQMNGQKYQHGQIFMLSNVVYNRRFLMAQCSGGRARWRACALCPQ